MTDAPANYEAVLITFSEISAHINGKWHTVVGQQTTIDLLQWTNGNSVLLGEAKLEAGIYTQIRLIVEKAEVRVDGKTYPMEVPSGSESGLKIHHTINLEAGAAYDLVIDFDASRSIVVKGDGTSQTRFQLKPVLRAVEFSSTGSVSGTILNYSSRTTAMAVQGTDTVTTSFAHSLSGDFTLAFLPPGTYTIRVVNVTGLVYIHSNVTVAAGANTNLGLVTLL